MIFSLCANVYFRIVLTRKKIPLGKKYLVYKKYTLDHQKTSYSKLLKHKSFADNNLQYLIVTYDF